MAQVVLAAKSRNSKMSEPSQRPPGALPGQQRDKRSLQQDFRGRKPSSGIRTLADPASFGVLKWLPSLVGHRSHRQVHSRGVRAEHSLHGCQHPLWEREGTSWRSCHPRAHHPESSCSVAHSVTTCCAALQGKGGLQGAMGAGPRDRPRAPQPSPGDELHTLISRK